MLSHPEVCFLIFRVQVLPPLEATATETVATENLSRRARCLGPSHPVPQLAFGLSPQCCFSARSPPRIPPNLISSGGRGGHGWASPDFQDILDCERSMAPWFCLSQRSIWIFLSVMYGLSRCAMNQTCADLVVWLYFWWHASSPVK